jgi:hypothetical protein
MRLDLKTAPLLALAFVLCLVAVRPAHAIKGINTDGTLDKPTVSKAYFEGEFWTVINALEAFRKSGMKTTREDSVYTFKYLSVVYAADPTTRKKAESYMYQLIKMMPTIDLIDLYISDNIESIFKKVKSDYEKLEKYHGSESNLQASHQDSSSMASPAAAAQAASVKPAAPAKDATAKADYPTAPEKPASQEGKKKAFKPWVPFALGGVAVAASAYLVLSLAGGETDNGGDAPRPVEVTVVTPNQGSQ